MFRNPYAQVALTYVRRPFSSWRGWFISVVFVFLPIPFVLIDSVRAHELPLMPLLIPLLFLFAYLAVHIKRQFADPRAHLTPGYRRVHATVAAIAALLCAVVLPSLLTFLLSRYLQRYSGLGAVLAQMDDAEVLARMHVNRAQIILGLHSIGLVSVAVLLFGTVLWVALLDAAWTVPALFVLWVAVFGTQSGAAGVRDLISGRFEPLAAALLGLGALMSVLAGIRLVRLNEDMPSYRTGMRWDWGRSQNVRQAWRDQWRILPGLWDRIQEREMARLTRHARAASQSWWSRVCRWQTGMVAGWSLWFSILIALIVYAMTWWILKPSTATMPMMGTISFALTMMPAMIATMGVLQWHTFKLGHELVLPVERKSYIRQLGAAAALSHFQLWCGMSVALVLWWLLVGLRPFPLAMLAGVLAISAAFQVGVFGVAVWAARYRLKALVTGLLPALLVPVAQVLQERWMASSPGEAAHEIMWIAGIMAVLGLLITLDAYRRWLVADFD